VPAAEVENMEHRPYPAIHTAANARAEAVVSEVAALRAHADELLSAIDELCGGPIPPTARRARDRSATDAVAA
jgi:hypothetical protein